MARENGEAITTPPSVSLVRTTKAIVVAIGRAVPVTMRMVRRTISISVILLVWTIAITRISMRRASSIAAGVVTISMRRARAPLWRTNCMLTILVEDRHTIMVLHYSAAIFSILVDKYCRIAVFDGRSEILAVWREYRSGLSERRAGVNYKKCCR